jgi:anti-sigma factor RsiW
MRCEDISDHDLELYVMGKLTDDAIRSHLDACAHCAPSVVECRDYVKAMKQVLGEMPGS